MNVLRIDMPPRAKGFVRANSDGSHTIVLNACLSVEQQKETYLHEMQHIRKGDLYATDSAEAIECERHGRG